MVQKVVYRLGTSNRRDATHAGEINVLYQGADQTVSGKTVRGRK